MPHVHAPGLVLRFDPRTLADMGASYAGDPDQELTAQQYFVCIEANARDALWLPLFAAAGSGRKGIAASAKTGHPRWIKYSSFYDHSTLCRIGHKAAQRAAEVAYDESSPKLPNRLTVATLPAREQFADDTTFRPLKENTGIR